MSLLPARARVAVLLSIAYLGVLLAPCEGAAPAPGETAFRHFCECPLHASHVGSGSGVLPAADLTAVAEMAPPPSLRRAAPAWQPRDPGQPDLEGPDPVPIAAVR